MRCKIGASVVTACTLLALTAQAGEPAPRALLRVACDGINTGAEVTINGEFKGECPFDVQVPAGPVELRAVKPAGEMRESIFEDSFKLGGGVVKKIDIVLGAPQLTAEGQAIAQERQAKERERLAQEAERAAQEKIIADEKARSDAAAKSAVEARKKNYNALLQKALQESGVTALDTLRDAEAVEPENPQTVRVRLVLAALEDDLGTLQDLLRATFPRNLLTTNDLATMPHIEAWLKRPEFEALITELAGNGGLESVRLSLSAAGRQRTIARIASSGFGQVSFYIGREEGTFRAFFYSFARRVVTSTQSTGGCTTTLALGAVTEKSVNVGDAVTPSRDIDWRKANKVVMSDPMTVSLEGRLVPEWEDQSFKTDSPVTARWLLDAAEGLRVACDPRRRNKR